MKIYRIVKRAFPTIESIDDWRRCLGGNTLISSPITDYKFFSIEEAFSYAQRLMNDANFILILIANLNCEKIKSLLKYLPIESSQLCVYRKINNGYEFVKTIQL